VADLGELEAVIMDQLWDAGEALTVRELLGRLPRKRPPAYTTVLTVCQNLERKGLLTHEPDGLAYRYSPVHSRDEHTAQLINTALGADGHREAALLTFVEQLSDTETEALRSALTRARRARRQKAT